MQARYYDPVIGRFYSNDPVGFRDVHSFNRYAYANNNPYKYTDPDGLMPESFDQWVNLGSGLIDVGKGSLTMTAGYVSIGLGAIGIIAPEPGTTLLGVGLVALGVAAQPIGRNDIAEGFEAAFAAWDNKDPVQGERLGTAGSLVNDALGVDGNTETNIGKTIDGAVSKLVGAKVPASNTLSAIDNAATVNDMRKSQEKIIEEK
jgi:uncharacterized protein RhaS with RHS repeats